MAGLGYIIKGKLWPPSPVTTSFHNKTVLVTGSNTGLGFEAALKYVELGATTVILAVRNLNKGQEAKDRIEQKTNVKGVVQVWELNMDKFSSVDVFAHRVDRDLPRLDVALLNAGVVAGKYELSSEGWEKMLQVNTLSTTLLAILLLPKLRASATPSSPTHLEVVASVGHMGAKLKPLKDPSRRFHESNHANDFSGSMAQYSLSKLYVMWNMREMARTLALGSNGQPLVIVNDTCPGACASEVMRDFKGFVGVLLSVATYCLAKTAEQGARTLVRATAMGVESHGRFVVTDDVASESPLITSKEGKVMGKAMWDETIEILSEKVPRLESIVESKT